jgi:16S rRNA (guanine527-N7)-methyltransferase
MADEDRLLSTLGALRDRGAIGEPSLERAIAHSESFVAAISTTARRLVDLGSGGGLPALVIALRRPDLALTLIDRRERRIDLLRLACAQLGITDRVEVVAGDVRALATDPGRQAAFDVVTARAFGEPIWTLRCAAPFLRAGGVVIVSEPPRTDLAQRWPVAPIAAIGLRPAPGEFPSVRCFERLDVPRETIT